MALKFRKQGDSLSRASAIISQIGGKKDDTDTKDTPPVETTTPPTEQNTPPAEPTTPPVETKETPAEPVSSKEVNSDDSDKGPEGVANPPKPDAPQPEPAKPDAVKPVEVTDDVIFSKLSETLGRKIESFDDLKPKELQLDPDLKELKEWKEKTGLPLSKWPEYNRDFSKMGDLDVAREILAQQYPNFTQEELNYSLKNFVYNEDDDEDSDKMKKSIALKKFAQEGRQKLEANKLKLTESQGTPTLTKEQQDAISYYSNVKQKEAETTKSQQEYHQKVKEASQTLNSLDLKLSDDLTIKYNVPAEVKNSLPKMVNEMPNWYNGDGSLNHANVVKDVAKVTNFEAIMEMVYKQGIAVGKEGKINPKGASAPTDPGMAPPSPQGNKKGNIGEVASRIAGGSSARPKLRFGKPKS